jgi:diacylglycerol O-acyltransferase
MPDAPQGAPLDGRALARDAIAYNARRFASLARGAADAVGAGARRALRDRGGLLADAGETLRAAGRVNAPMPEPLSPIMTERHGWWRFDRLAVPVEGLRRAAKSVDGTINDAFVAAVTGALGRYHDRHGAPVGELRVTMPISTRTATDAIGGNHQGAGRFSLPVGVDDAAARMTDVHTRVGVARSDTRWPLSNLAGVINVLGPGAAGAMLRNVDFVVSNVPGIDVPVFLAGAEAEAIYGFGPPLGSAVNVTLLSYRGTAFIGVTADAAAVPDRDVFVECLAEGLDDVLALGR